MLVLFGFLLTACQANHIGRGPYLQSVATDSVLVVWETPLPSQGRVDYGMGERLDTYVQEMEATTHHAIRISALLPNQEYSYRVCNGGKYTFRTAARPDHNKFRFAALGDTRENPLLHRLIAQRIAWARPNFVLHMGDMVETGSVQSVWNDFFKAEAPLLRTAPFYPTLGNHEYNALQKTLYFDIFHLPGIERYYTFEYGDALFICLDNDGYGQDVYYPEDEQLAWLEQQLAQNQHSWTIVFFHMPVFSSTSEDPLEQNMRALLVPLFEKYRVDLVLMGHDHGYERLLVNGIHYVITAGGGASLKGNAYTEPGSVVNMRAANYVIFDMDGSRLSAVVRSEWDKVLDQFEVRK